MASKYVAMGQLFAQAQVLAQKAADEAPLVWCASRYGMLLHGAGRMSESALRDYGIPSLARLEGGDHLIMVPVKCDGGAKHDAGVLVAYEFLKEQGVPLTLEDRGMNGDK